MLIELSDEQISEMFMDYVKKEFSSRYPDKKVRCQAKFRRGIYKVAIASTDEAAEKELNQSWLF